MDPGHNRGNTWAFTLVPNLLPRPVELEGITVHQNCI